MPLKVNSDFTNSEAEMVARAGVGETEAVG